MAIITSKEILISHDSPLKIGSGSYQYYQEVSLEMFHDLLDGILLNVAEDEISDFDFYYERHYYDINNLEDDFLINAYYYSGIVKVYSLRQLKEDLEMIDYELPSAENDYVLKIIVGGEEHSFDDFNYFDGTRGKIVVYNDEYYYLDEMEQLPAIESSDFFEVKSLKVNQFYFTTLEELKNYQTDDKVLYLEIGQLKLIDYQELRDIFESYDHLLIENQEFSASYDFNANKFVVRRDPHFYYYEFGENEITIWGPQMKVVIPSEDFNNQSFINTFLDNDYELREMYRYAYQVYYELTKFIPQKSNTSFVFDLVELYIEDGDLYLWSMTHPWYHSKITLSNDEIRYDILELMYSYNYQLTINNNITTSINYYFVDPWFYYDYEFIDALFIGAYNYDQFGNVDYESQFYYGQFYEVEQIIIFALYEHLQEVDYYLDLYLTEEKYILIDYQNELVYKVHLNHAIDIYYDDEIVGYIDLITGDKYIILEGKRYLTTNPILLNVIDLLSHLDVNRFVYEERYGYSYESNGIRVVIGVTDPWIDVSLYEEDVYFNFGFILEDFDSFDFSEYEDGLEEIIELDIARNGIIYVSQYKNLRFIVTYNTGLQQVLTYRELEDLVDFEINFGKYETIITATIDGDVTEFKLKSPINFIYDDTYGAMFIFDDSLIIYKDDLIISGDYPAYDISQLPYYRVQGWTFDDEALTFLEFLDATDHINSGYYWLYPIFEVIDYEALVDIFESYEYLVLENHEFIAYYNFKEDYFYIEGYEGLMYLEINDENIVFITHQYHIIMPKDDFNQESFVDNFFTSWYIREIYLYLHAIRDDLKNGQPVRDGEGYILNSTNISLRFNELFISTWQGFGVESEVSFTNDEYEREIDYQYEYHLIVNNNIASQIDYYFDDMWFDFNYQFQNSVLTGVYNYDEFLEVDYESTFNFYQFYDENEITVYAVYEQLKDVGYYLEFYQNQEKYKLSAHEGVYLYKINTTQSIDIYIHEEIVGYIDLMTGNKYIYLDGTMYLTQNPILFNFVEFFNNVDEEDFRLVNNQYYEYYDNNFYFRIYLSDFRLEVLDYNVPINLSLDFSSGEFESLDVSGFEFAVEEIVDITLASEREIIYQSNYQHELRFKVMYNTSIENVMTFYQLNQLYEMQVFLNKYETTVIIGFENDEIEINLRDNNVFIYNENYGVLFNFDDEEFLYQSDLEGLEELPSISIEDPYYQFLSWKYNGQEVTIEELINEERFHYDIYYLEPNYTLVDYQDMVDVFNSYEYLILDNYEFTAYYNFKLNHFYVESYEELIYFEFGDDEIIFMDQNVKVVFPTTRLHQQSFQETFMYNTRIIYIYKHLYSIYYELNQVDPEVTAHLSYLFENVEIYFYGSNLEIESQEGFWMNSYLVLSNDEIDQSRFNWEPYLYQLQINNNISDPIFYDSNSIHNYHNLNYEFISSYLVGIYNYDQLGEVNFESTFDYWQFNEENQIVVYSKYEELHEANYYYANYLNTPKYILSGETLELRVDLGNVIDIYDPQSEMMIGYINLETGDKYRLIDDILYLTEDLSLFNVVDFFNNVDSNDFVYNKNSGYVYAGDDIFVAINIWDYSMILLVGNYAYFLNMLVQDFEAFDFSSYEVSLEEVVDVEIIPSLGMYISSDLEDELKFLITYNTNYKKTIGIHELLQILDVEIISERYETIFEISLEKEVLSIKLSDGNYFLFQPTYGPLFNFDYKYLIYQDDLEALGEIPSDIDPYFNVTSWYNPWWGVVGFEELISPYYFNEPIIYELYSGGELKNIYELLDVLENVLYFDNGNVSGYYDVMNDTFLTTDGVRIFFIDDDAYYCNEDFLIKFDFNNYLPIYFYDYPYLEKNNIEGLLELRKLMKREFILEDLWEFEYYLNTGILEVAYDGLNFRSHHTHMTFNLQVTDLEMLPPFVVDSYDYELTLVTPKYEDMTNFEIILRFDEVTALDSLKNAFTYHTIADYIYDIDEFDHPILEQQINVEELEPGAYKFYFHY